MVSGMGWTLGTRASFGRVAHVFGVRLSRTRTARPAPGVSSKDKARAAVSPSASRVGPRRVWTAGRLPFRVGTTLNLGGAPTRERARAER